MQATKGGNKMEKNMANITRKKMGVENKIDFVQKILIVHLAN